MGFVSTRVDGFNHSKSTPGQFSQSKFLEGQGQMWLQDLQFTCTSLL